MKPATDPKPVAAMTNASGIVRRLGALRRLVFGTIRIERAGARVRIAFGEADRLRDTRTAAPVKATKPMKELRRQAPAQAAAESAAGTEFGQMRQELSIFLNGARNRKSLRHLAFFESVMLKRGPQALESVSFDTLKKAHVQLNLLLNVAPSRTLRVLSSKMLVALVAREDEGEVQILDNRKTDFMPSNLPA